MVDWHFNIHETKYDFVHTMFIYLCKIEYLYVLYVHDEQ